jgi:hypothetical protein
MRSLLHLLSVILVLPGVALAGALSILGHAMARQSLLGFLGDLLATVLWLVPWGLLASCVALLALVLGGFSARFRWLAALCVVTLAVGSSVVLLTLTPHSSFSAEQLWFFVPAAVSASVGLWLTATEFPRKRVSSASLKRTAANRHGVD